MLFHRLRTTTTRNLMPFTTEGKTGESFGTPIIVLPHQGCWGTNFEIRREATSLLKDTRAEVKEAYTESKQRTIPSTDRKARAFKN